MLLIEQCGLNDVSLLWNITKNTYSICNNFSFLLANN